ncbi:unnamed protein product [Ectocarpus sp. CCAP 1310/34]|nr:unnamed protein product [Ectocarpus sp. CCAP 1310/34]
MVSTGSDNQERLLCYAHREQHSVAVDSEGVAYSWGSGGSRWDGAGALGLGNLENENFLVSNPTEITTLSGVGAKVIAPRGGGGRSALMVCWTVDNASSRG